MSIKLRIREWWRHNRGWMIAVLIFVLVTTLSFGVGYLVARETNPAPIVIKQCPR